MSAFILRSEELGARKRQAGVGLRFLCWTSKYACSMPLVFTCPKNDWDMAINHSFLPFGCKQRIKLLAHWVQGGVQDGPTHRSWTPLPTSSSLPTTQPCFVPGRGDASQTGNGFTSWCSCPVYAVFADLRFLLVLQGMTLPGLKVVTTWIDPKNEGSDYLDWPWWMEGSTLVWLADARYVVLEIRWARTKVFRWLSQTVGEWKRQSGPAPSADEKESFKTPTETGPCEASKQRSGLLTVNCHSAKI